jgi:hypothetical protein
MPVFGPRFMLATFTESEVQRWLHLRAIEWAAWPAFVTQPVVPILFALYPFLSVAIALVVADFLWRFVRYSFISPSLARIGALFVGVLKWPSAVGAAIYLLSQHRYGTSALALLWPFLAAYVSLPMALLARAVRRPTLIGRIELELAKRVGYVSQDAVL